MNKKKLVILLSAVLALVLAAVLIIASFNQEKPGGILPADPADEQPTIEQPAIEQPVIGVEETEPSLGSNGEIDFDDLLVAGNEG